MARPGHSCAIATTWRQNQIAKAGKPRERLCPRAQRQSKGAASRPIRGQQGGTRAFAITCAHRGTTSDGDHILQGAAQFRPRHIGVAIDAQMRRGQQAHEPRRRACRSAGEGQRGGQATGDFGSKTGARQQAGSAGQAAAINAVGPESVFKSRPCNRRQAPHHSGARRGSASKLRKACIGKARERPWRMPARPCWP